MSHQRGHRGRGYVARHLRKRASWTKSTSASGGDVSPRFGGLPCRHTDQNRCRKSTAGPPHAHAPRPRCCAEERAESITRHGPLASTAQAAGHKAPLCIHSPTPFWVGLLQTDFRSTLGKWQHVGLCAVRPILFTVKRLEIKFYLPRLTQRETTTRGGVGARLHWGSKEESRGTQQLFRPPPEKPF